MLPALKAHVCTPMLRKVTLACKPTHLHRRPFNTSVAASAGVANSGDLVTTRAATERLAKNLQFSIAGVTFDNRQEPVSQLTKGQSLMLLNEPSNEHDPNAVAVHTLRGVCLGYVPKETNSGLKVGLGFAKVLSAGKNEADKYGAIASAYPDLLFCAVQPLPSSQAASNAITELQNKLGPDSSAFKEAIEVSRGACEVTGINASRLSEPLQAMLCWKYDPDQKEIKLLRVATVCAQVLTIQQHLAEPSESKACEQAINFASVFNKWTVAEVMDHLAWAKSQRALMDAEEWKVNVSL